MDEEYNRLVMICRDNKLDFDIQCGAKEHKQFILNVMDIPSRNIVNGVEYYLGSKYQVMMYNLKLRIGQANFNNKGYYKAIQKIRREFD